MMTRRLLQLFTGLAMYGISLAMFIRAGLGLDPWDVFHQGVAGKTGLSIGAVVVIVSFLVLLLWIPLRQWPGFGTLCNAVLVGVFADVGLALIPEFSHLGGQIGMLAGAVLLNGIASACYIGARFGPGARDGLMTGLARRTGWSVRTSRTGIEIVVLATGWLLGGSVGVGTVVYALAIGPLVQLLLPRFTVPEASRPLPPAAARGRPGSAGSRRWRLAARAPVDVPFLGAGLGGQYAVADGCAAFQARPVLTTVYPVSRPAGHPAHRRSARAEDGGAAARSEVGLQQLFGGGHHGAQVGHVGDRRGGVDAGQETGLAAVDVADAGEVALVQQGYADGNVRRRAQPPFGLLHVPVRTQEIRPEMADDGILVSGPDHLQDAEGKADGIRGGSAEHAPGSEPRFTPPSAGRVDLPRTLHLQVRMDGQPFVSGASKAHEEVLAAGHHLVHGPAGQLQGGEPGHAEIGGCELLPGQGGVKLRGRPPDGVAFRHGFSVLSEWNKRRRASVRRQRACPGCRGR